MGLECRCIRRGVQHRSLRLRPSELRTIQRVERGPGIAVDPRAATAAANRESPMCIIDASASQIRIFSASVWLRKVETTAVVSQYGDLQEPRRTEGDLRCHA